MSKSGKFVVSLDFELFWGIRDSNTSEKYKKNIIGVRKVLPRLIKCFDKYNIKGTFAIVGFLFASKKEEIIHYSPLNKPNYTNPKLSPYNGYFDLINKDEEEDQSHYASKAISLLQKNSNHEIASHTFSHYYCLEEGQTKKTFKEDLIAAIKIAEKDSHSIKSLIFPRNQVNQNYLDILPSLGINSYRGNQKAWFYNFNKDSKIKIFRKMFRLLDSYINLSGHNCYNLEKTERSLPINIPSSSFLRPYSKYLRFYEEYKIKRILNSMTYAAKNNKIYHLWWHPHNFGINQDQNFRILIKILNHYTKLNKEYNFQSITMSCLAEYYITKS